MKISWRNEWPFWALLAAMGAAAAICWSHAPDRIPVHWNMHGEVDRYGGKAEGLLLLPAISFGLYCLLLFIPRLDPGKENYKLFAGAYYGIRLSIQVFFVILYGAIFLTAFGYEVSVGKIVFVSVGALFVVLGNVMGKLRPNWFAGIRTPWTLSSKLSWTKTHRAGGWTFVGIGLAAIAAAFFDAKWALFTFIGGAVIGVLGLVVYSYIVWRNDPDRVPPAGSSPERSMEP